MCVQLPFDEHWAVVVGRSTIRYFGLRQHMRGRRAAEVFEVRSWREHEMR